MKSPPAISPLILTFRPKIPIRTNTPPTLITNFIIIANSVVIFRATNSFRDTFFNAVDGWEGSQVY